MKWSSKCLPSHGSQITKRIREREKFVGKGSRNSFAKSTLENWKTNSLKSISYFSFMGKPIPSSSRFQDFARIITSDRIQQQSKRGPKLVSNKTRVVPPPEPAKPKGIRIVQSERQQQRIKIMEENSSMNRRIPLGEVVLECSRRWFQDTLKEAKAGDTGMQVLVGQMYCSGYGVVKNAQKGQAWISRASRSRSSVWKVGDKHPGYNASDSDTEEEKDEGKQQ
ncbi:uncharacterized protein LOC111919675 [Lactuca sativa]|uniref:Uncharacterized protein n=1 Tax=Lactuca sativa TaxID=4236 RepID=A0A9R1USY3_LACSA|nr:uncharacterized protein LOC111919675 [Lactuca sativa]KAJ0192353.1 hypothetical protein LSAT_V11C800393950 [Lactuca sativa]